jgi:hypothetical protein
MFLHTRNYSGKTPNLTNGATELSLVLPLLAHGKNRNKDKKS